MEHPHTVAYPAQWRALDERRLLLLSQTDVTPEPLVGLQYAAAAYDKALRPSIADEQPTAVGEAASKAGFRSTQAGLPLLDSELWIERSLTALDRDEPGFRRQRIAALLLAGRGRALRLFRDAVDAPEYLEDAAKTAFTEAASESVIVHNDNGEKRWDPYATMLSWQHATFEAVRPSGKSRDARRIALAGIRQAIMSDPEQANTPHQKDGWTKHNKFIVKHVALNAIAYSLAIKRPVTPHFMQKRRYKQAARLLG